MSGIVLKLKNVCNSREAQMLKNPKCNKYTVRIFRGVEGNIHITHKRDTIRNRTQIRQYTMNNVMFDWNRFVAKIWIFNCEWKGIRLNNLKNMTQEMFDGLCLRNDSNPNTIKEK